MLAMGVSTGPKALHVFAVYIGRNDNAEYKVSRDRYAIYFCDRQTDFRKEPSVGRVSCGVRVPLCRGSDLGALGARSSPALARPGCVLLDSMPMEHGIGTYMNVDVLCVLRSK